MRTRFFRFREVAQPFRSQHALSNAFIREIIAGID